MTNFEVAADVKRFWFGDELYQNMNNLQEIENRMSIWFNGASAEFDNIQRNHAALLTDDALTTSWDGAEGLLAKIILFDQFPRLIYRGTKKAFSFDSKAIAAATVIYNDSILLTSYSAIELLFIGVCLQHSEELNHQEMGLKIAELINSSAPKDIANFISNLKGYPHEHYEVVKRFGRFPSRNMALDRETTPEETEWLSSPDCPAWARSQMVAQPQVKSEAAVEKRKEGGKKEGPVALYGSVKPYKRHAIICGGGNADSWSSHVEDSHEIIRCIQGRISEEVKLTLCDRPNSTPDYTDVIVYPDAILYQVTVQHALELADFLSNNNDNSGVGKAAASPSFSSKPMPFAKLILVCIHGTRDKRCGRAGPQVVTEMRKRLQEEGVSPETVSVYGSSHIGGHAFAGTLVVYPSSDWYGFVTAKGSSVPSILDAVIANKVYEKCHRGCANLPSW